MPQQTSGSSYPYSSAHVVDEKRSPGRRDILRRTHTDMTKVTSSYSVMSTPKAAYKSSGSSSSGGSYTASASGSGSGSSAVVTPSRPSRVTASTSTHRRQSSQSLTLDLEGLDLGQGVRSAGGVIATEQPKEEVPWSRTHQARSRSRFRANTTAARLPEEASRGEKQVEDSFFAHLRKCEDSHDILDTAHALSPSNLYKTDEQDGVNTASQQVLGGFASLGYSSNPTSLSNVHVIDADSENSPSSSVPVSPYLGNRKTHKLPWRTLSPVLHDPMNTLDILSIEEMGLHGIDVGNKDDWEGFSMSYQGMPVEPATEGIRPAQWVVAKSSRNQKKWIVAPESLSPCRTVIVSASGPQKREQPTLNPDSPPVFVCTAKFDLRFLRAGESAPSITTILTFPAGHRSSARDIGQAESTAAAAASSVMARDEPVVVQSLGIDEEQESANVSVHCIDTADSQAQDGQSSSRQSMEKPVQETRPPLVHSKSSSTIHATILPMIQLESRRPSLGKSVSHESLSFHSPKIDASRRSSRLSVTASTINDSGTIKGYWQASNALFEPLVVHDTAGGELAFADYSIGLKEGDKEAKEGSSNPSPRSSLQVRSSMSDSREASDRIPVLSTIDSERMAEYYRMSSSSDRGTPNFSALHRLNEMAWQQGGVSSTPSNVRSSGRKDRRLSVWLKKKVMPSGAVSPPSITTPLPAAWEQQRELHNNAATSTTNRNTAKAIKIGKPVKSYSNFSKSSGSTSTSPPASKADMYPSTVGSPFTLSQTSLCSTLQVEAEDKEQSKPTYTTAAAATPLSQMYDAHGHNIWPGVFSQRNERRRSNSDDGLATLSEAARKKLDTPAPRQSIESSLGDDSLGQLSLSLPSHSVLSTYLPLDAIAAKATPVDLMDLDNCPQRCMTMVIPLPLSRRSDQTSARYIRISYVPFGSEQQGSSDDSDRESADEGAPVPALSTQSSLPAWYRKLTNAWIPTGARSGSPGSNDDEFSPPSDPPSNMLESFRIIAKVLEAPNQRKLAYKDYSLPPTTPFPVILGWCDQQRSVKLVPEGWQAIGLANGPADSEGPLYGLADLIMAGCASCMEL